MKFAFWCYLITALAIGATGLLYLLSPKIMPYHEQVIALDWALVAPRFQMMFLALMKGVGVGALASSISMTTLLLIPFRPGGEAWARLLILALGLINLLPALYFTLKFKLALGVSTPWQFPAVALALLICGFLLSSGIRKPDK